MVAKSSLQLVPGPDSLIHNTDSQSSHHHFHHPCVYVAHLVSIPFQTASVACWKAVCLKSRRYGDRTPIRPVVSHMYTSGIDIGIHVVTLPGVIGSPLGHAAQLSAYSDWARLQV